MLGRSHALGHAALEARDVSVRRCGRSLAAAGLGHRRRRRVPGVARSAGLRHRHPARLLAGAPRARRGPGAGGRPRAAAPGRDAVFPDAVRPGRAWCGGARRARRRGRTARASHDGLDPAAAHRVLAAAAGGRPTAAPWWPRWRRRRRRRRHATTIALFVAGRMLSWGPPAVALVPALQLLGDPGRAALAARRSSRRRG